jgi:hypothetical protein
VASFFSWAAVTEAWNGMWGEFNSCHSTAELLIPEALVILMGKH